MATSARFSVTDASAAASATSKRAGAGDCERCKTPGARAVLHVQLAAVCEACLLASVAGKLRAMLTRSSALGRKVALGYSGGPSSRLALDVLFRAMHTGRKRRLFSDVCAVLVDTRSAFEALPWTPADAATRECLLRAAVVESLRSGFHTLVIPMEAVFAADGCVEAASVWALTPGMLPVELAHQQHERTLLTPAAVAEAVELAMQQLAAVRAGLVQPRQKLQALIGAVPTSDAREDLLTSLRRRLLLQAAVSTSCDALVTAECADSMARGVLVGVCSGRGLSLPLDAAPEDDRFVYFEGGGGDNVRSPWDLGAPYSEGKGTAAAATAPAPPRLSTPPCPWYPTLMHDATSDPARRGVVVLRPLMEVEAREVAMFNRLRRLDTSVSPSFVTMARQRTSINHASEALLCALQPAFRNTVHNVVRTSQKLQLPHGQGGARGSGSGVPRLPLCAMCASVIATAPLCIACARILHTAARSGSAPPPGRRSRATAVLETAAATGAATDDGYSSSRPPLHSTLPPYVVAQLVRYRQLCGAGDGRVEPGCDDELLCSASATAASLGDAASDDFKDWLMDLCSARGI